jgi:hypothetical protein
MGLDPAATIDEDGASAGIGSATGLVAVPSCGSWGGRADPATVVSPPVIGSVSVPVAPTVVAVGAHACPVPKIKAPARSISRRDG